jgi:GNAT superfamily N-acetyltransferase
MEVSIRDAAESDLEAICYIYKRSSLANRADRELLLGHPELFEQPPPAVAEGRTRVALNSNDEVIAFASTFVLDEALEIEDLFVAPSWMRRGVGRMLVLDVFAIARQRGIWHVEVTANPAARAFYESLGFRFSHVTQTQFADAPRLLVELT